MTRIIAGDAGGVALTVPATGTRPTSERVRESLFGALQSAGALAAARVLDLYAGSGALGLEALSRGAASAVLVDRSPAAARAAAANAARVMRAAGGAATTHRGTARSYLRTASASFDLVFLDPPYAVSDAEVATVLRALPPLLSAGAVVVVERATRSGTPPTPPPLRVDRERRYGDTTLWWLSADDGQPAEPSR